MALDRPIIIIGHARGGTTLLTALINWHSQVGIKEEIMVKNKNINSFISKLAQWNLKPEHLSYSRSKERADVWHDYLSVEKVLTWVQMGKELITEDSFTEKQKEIIKARLTEGLEEPRFITKSPSLSYAVKILPDIFPNAKIIAIYRHPLQVINSWRPIRHQQEVPMMKKVYTLLCTKWTETIEYLEEARAEMGFIPIVYDDLITNTQDVLTRIFDYCELPIEDYIKTIKLEDKREWYKQIMPVELQELVVNKTQKGWKLLDNIMKEQENNNKWDNDAFFGKKETI